MDNNFILIINKNVKIYQIVAQKGTQAPKNNKITFLLRTAHKFVIYFSHGSIMSSNFMYLLTKLGENKLQFLET